MNITKFCYTVKVIIFAYKKYLLVRTLARLCIRLSGGLLNNDITLFYSISVDFSHSGKAERPPTCRSGNLIIMVCSCFSWNFLQKISYVKISEFHSMFIAEFG